MGGINKIFLLEGARGKGKTTFIKDVFVRNNALPHCLIVDTFDNPAWHNLGTISNPSAIQIPLIEPDQLSNLPQGISRVFSNDPADLFERIRYYCWNTFLVFDDATRSIDGQTRTNKDVIEFVLNSKQRNLNALFAFHSLIDIPRDLIRYADYLTMFKSGDPTVPEKFKARPEVLRAFEALRSSTDNYANITLEIN